NLPPHLPPSLPPYQARHCLIFPFSLLVMSVADSIRQRGGWEGTAFEEDEVEARRVGEREKEGEVKENGTKGACTAFECTGRTPLGLAREVGAQVTEESHEGPKCFLGRGVVKRNEGQWA
ncbi:hypothetical protein Naga_101842g1, partial [Nannochloropsis gaditana]